MDSNCKAESWPESMVPSGKFKVYLTFGGSTLDNELDSTTASGCFSPIRTEIEIMTTMINAYNKAGFDKRYFKFYLLG